LRGKIIPYEKKVKYYLHYSFICITLLEIKPNKNMKTNLEELKVDAISMWKKYEVESATMLFNCGGDDMGDTEWSIQYDVTKFSNISDDLDKIIAYLDIVVYNAVEFYVNSDGEYLGESGNVVVELKEEDIFDFYKTSSSEWCERHSAYIEVELNDNEFNLINDYVMSCSNDSDNNMRINYKKDLILTDKIENIFEEIKNKIYDICKDYEWEMIDGDQNEYWQWEFDSAVNIDVPNKKFEVVLWQNFTIFKDDF
jgi:hypothetical protein